MKGSGNMISLENKLENKNEVAELTRENDRLKEANRKLEEEKRELLGKLEQMQRMLNINPLTGIASRRFFDEYLKKEWGRAKRQNWTLSLIMLDIDYFKQYNDTYRHVAGDDCLRMVAEKLKKSLRRQEDIVARYGGEEFAVLLPNTEFKAALILANKLREGIEELRIPHCASVKSIVTVSGGVASFAPGQHDIDPKLLIKKADEALYIAKNSGRNRVAYKE